MSATTQYERVIEQWCQATGMEPWPASDTMHVDIDGTTIGLIYDEEMPDLLHAYVDLGSYEHADCHQRLLQQNLAIDPDLNGYFGLHPESGSVVFRTSIPLTPDTNGAVLPSLLHAAVEAARQRVRA